jgi:hypothetical protein
MYYVAVDAQGRWVALLLFSAAARHLKHRDQWIGWTRPSTRPPLESGGEQQSILDSAEALRASASVTH